MALYHKKERNADIREKYVVIWSFAADVTGSRLGLHIWKRQKSNGSNRNSAFAVLYNCLPRVCMIAYSFDS